MLCSVSFSFLEVGIDVLEMDSAFGTGISPSLAFQVVVSAFQRALLQH